MDFTAEITEQCTFKRVLPDRTLGKRFTALQWELESFGATFRVGVAPCESPSTYCVFQTNRLVDLVINQNMNNAL
jgi:hypothetical protein